MDDDPFNLGTLLDHHAYCIVGPRSLSEKLCQILNRRHKIEVIANPDFFRENYEIFAIDDARTLKSRHETKPVFPDGRRVFVISLDNITVEAQNALLKLLEEPAEYACFFLIVPSVHILLPTVRSRLRFIEYSGGVRHDRKSASTTELAKNFLRSGISRKMELIKDLIEDLSKDKKTKRDVIDFLSNLQSDIHASGKIKENMRRLEAIETALKYATDRSPSMKMLLEYVALNI